MQRVKRSTAVAVLPADPAGGTPGYFPQPDPGGGVPAAVPGYEWYNNVQEEIVNVILAAGGTLDGNNRAQLRDAIQALIATGGVPRKVRVSTTANITLSGGAPNVTNGVTLAAGDRILVPSQSTGSENGIYTVSTLGTGSNGTWTRATDADGAGDMFGSMLVAVSEGSANSDSLWMLITNDPITIGTTELTFLRKDAGGIPDASTTVQGIVELATDAEAQALSDALRALTPSTLAGALRGSNQSLGTNGYQKLPGGLIIQWGTTGSISISGGTEVVTLPIAFPTVNFGAFENQNGSPTASQASNSVSAKTLTTITVRNSSGTASTFSWIAIGY